MREVTVYVHVSRIDDISLQEESLVKMLGDSMILNTGIKILYGSETGNAQEYAVFLSKRLYNLGLRSTLSALDDFPLKELVTKTQYLIIVCSTTGQGEVPRNGRRFLNFILKKRLPDDLLNHIKLSTLGIGDSSYPKFNFAIRKIHTRLTQIGCLQLCERCEADEMSPEGVDAYYSEWEKRLIEALKNEFSLNNVAELPLRPEFKIKINHEMENVINSKTASEVSLTRLKNSGQDLKEAKLVFNRRVTAEDHFQDVRHLKLESEDLNYMPGDTVALFPYNDSASVERLLQLQKHWLPYADKPLSISGNYPSIAGGFIDSLTLTLRSLITHHLDIMSVPRRSFFMTLWHFVDTATEDGLREREKLQEFSNIEESEELYNYANRPRRLILETLIEFEQNLKIPVEFVLDLFPMIKPRLFLIASGPCETSVELVIAIVEYKTILRRVRKGLCTNWLKKIPEGSNILISIQSSNLDFESANLKNAPILMVAPGTGIAPMKSLIDYTIVNNPHRELYLFPGCRYKEKDYLFREHWHNLQLGNKLAVYPSFSRERASDGRYVQDTLFLEKRLVADLLLQENAIFYLCGSSGAMPRQVRITLCEILIECGQLEEAAAAKYIERMEKDRRYLQETW